MNKNRVGLVFGFIIGGLHLVWSILVAFGWAQPLVDFIFKLHMIQPFVVIADFSLGLSVGLIALTAIIGYVLGYVFAVVWDIVHK